MPVSNAQDLRASGYWGNVEMLLGGQSPSDPVCEWCEAVKAPVTMASGLFRVGLFVNTAKSWW